MRKALVTIAALGCALWLTWLLQRPTPATPLEPTPRPTATPASSPPRSEPLQSFLATSADAGGSRAKADAGAGACAPRASRVCRGGDVWWRDGCGRLGSKAEECGVHLCEAGACAEPDGEPCGELDAFGHCEGDVVVACHAGHIKRYDCSDAGNVCVIGEEGATCRSPPEQRCEAGQPPSCSEDGRLLHVCREGGWEPIDCTARGARCERHGTDEAACIQRAESFVSTLGSGRSAATEEECGRCGCPSQGLEVCNDTDDDADDKVDEGGVCDVVPLVAYVVADASGSSSYAQADLDRELQRIQSAFGDGLSSAGFTWLDTLELRKPEWLELETGEYGALSNHVAHAQARLGFHIPVVFTNRISSGGVDKLGISTLPNGRCAGMRRDFTPQPLHGVVAVAKARSATTTAHEIGHYLGLCHTHTQLAEATHRVVEDAHGAFACAEDCAQSGDGVCDTPHDPGPRACVYTSQCRTHCDVAASPDARNVMSYYTACRSQFTPEQLEHMRRGLALRRDWAACLRPEGCTCEPGAGDCPTQMTCRPASGKEGGTLWRCDLNGFVDPGRACKHQGECAHASVCIRHAGRQICARTCRAGEAACTCRVLQAGGLGVCSEDLAG